ncbi:MAG: hypothetical protein AB8G26_02660 [Ilumatobacter sp.]
MSRSDDVTVVRLRDGSVARLKRLIAVVGAIFVFATLAAVFAAISAAVLGTGGGADPDRAFSPTSNGTDAFSVDVEWAPDAVLDREMEPTTRAALADAWVRSAEALSRATSGDSSGLEVWFVDGALAAAQSRSEVGDDSQVSAPPAQRHLLGVDFYSLDGQIVVVTAETERLDGPDQRTEAILVLSDGNWRIRHVERRPLDEIRDVETG